MKQTDDDQNQSALSWSSAKHPVDTHLVFLSWSLIFFSISASVRVSSRGHHWSASPVFLMAISTVGRGFSLQNTKNKEQTLQSDSVYLTAAFDGCWWSIWLFFDLLKHPIIHCHEISRKINKLFLHLQMSNCDRGQHCCLGFQYFIISPPGKLRQQTANKTLHLTSFNFSLEHNTLQNALRREVTATSPWQQHIQQEM